MHHSVALMPQSALAPPSGFCLKKHFTTYSHVAIVGPKSAPVPFVRTVLKDAFEKTDYMVKSRLHYPVHFLVITYWNHSGIPSHTICQQITTTVNYWNLKALCSLMLKGHISRIPVIGSNTGHRILRQINPVQYLYLSYSFHSQHATFSIHQTGALPFIMLYF